MNLLLSLAGAALLAGQPGTTYATSDPRIQLVLYDPGHVVTLSVGLGYAAVIELATDERVDSVVVGDAAAWQVTASKRGDQVVVKPLSGASATDMIVTTGERRYVFQLQTGSGEGLQPFVLRFAYPAAAAVEPIQPVPSTVGYRFSGSKALFPTTMRDDGVRTVISWSRATPTPAIFAIGRDGREALINGRMLDDDYVVEGISPKFVFRLGTEQAIATRMTRRKQ